MVRAEHSNQGDVVLLRPWRHLSPPYWQVETRVEASGTSISSLAPSHFSPVPLPQRSPSVLFFHELC